MAKNKTTIITSVNEDGMVSMRWIAPTGFNLSVASYPDGSGRQFRKNLQASLEKRIAKWYNDNPQYIEG